MQKKLGELDQKWPSESRFGRNSWKSDIPKNRDFWREGGNFFFDHVGSILGLSTLIYFVLELKPWRCSKLINKKSIVIVSYIDFLPWRDMNESWSSWEKLKKKMGEKPKNKLGLSWAKLRQSWSLAELKLELTQSNKLCRFKLCGDSATSNFSCWTSLYCF